MNNNITSKTLLLPLEKCPDKEAKIQF